MASASNYGSVAANALAGFTSPLSQAGAAHYPSHAAGMQNANPYMNAFGAQQIADQLADGGPLPLAHLTGDGVAHDFRQQRLARLRDSLRDPGVPDDEKRRIAELLGEAVPA